MDALVDKYEKKIIQSGLGLPSGPHSPLVGGLDDTLVWNRDAEEKVILEQVFNGLNINSLVLLRPTRPYSELIRYLSEQALKDNGLITPKDCETRTFLHDLPVINKFDSGAIIPILKKRKSVIILPDLAGKEESTPAILTHGTVSPEQGFVTVSSVCFACFIKFFTDYLFELKNGTVSNAAHKLFDHVSPMISDYPETLPQLDMGPFIEESQVYKAVIQAGKMTVEYDLVDSYFGNVSYLWKNRLYISQTASSLDELSGCIDPVPLDQSSSAGLTASSELSAHLETIEKTGCRAILHGHPKFSVILSMDCEPKEMADCQFNKECHIKCPKKRFIDHIPIVPGEVGTGPTGLCNTLPAALETSESAIVYGHGLFTTGKKDFNDAFKTMLEAETMCRKKYFTQVKKLRRK